MSDARLTAESTAVSLRNWVESKLNHTTGLDSLMSHAAPVATSGS